MRSGDILVRVEGHDVKWLPLADVETLISEAGQSLNVTVVTPMEPPRATIPVPDPDDTLRSSHSSGSSDMKQMNGTVTSTFRRKMHNLTFLKNKKSMKHSDSLPRR